MQIDVFKSLLTCQCAMLMQVSVDDLGLEFLRTGTLHESSHKARAAYWEFFVKNAKAMAATQDEDRPLGYRQIRRKAAKIMPQIEVEQIKIHRQTKVESRFKGQQLKGPSDCERLIFLEAKISV